MNDGGGVREARVADAAEVARLCVELGYAATTAEMSGRLTAMLAGGDHYVAVAEDADAGLVGWIAAERRLLLEYGESAEITGLVVAADARRAGVGTALVAAVERWAERRGLARMNVRSKATREAAHPFYEGLGYRRIKTQHVYERWLDQGVSE